MSPINRHINRMVRVRLYRAMATRLELGKITPEQMARILRRWADTDERKITQQKVAN